MVKCKVCGSRLTDRMKKCPVCGAVPGSTKAGNIAKDANLPKYLCPLCKAEIISEHRYCPSCMKDLSQAAKTADVQEPAGSKCIQCGAYLPVGAKFCHACGAKQELLMKANPLADNVAKDLGGMKETSLEAFTYEVCGEKYILKGVKDTSLTDIVLPGVFSEIEGKFEEENISPSLAYDGLNTVSLYGVFDGCKKLKSVTIPDTITKIGTAAFARCESLTNIAIPYSVIEIGYSAFENCLGITNITIPNSVIEIGGVAFKDCSGLTNVTIPNSVTEIEASAFRSCSSLTSIIIPNSVIEIGDSAFEDCSGLTNITIPNSVTKIGFHAFANCSSLTNVTIPNSVTEIEASAFWSCSSLTSITIPNSVVKIGKNSFKHCNSLKNVSIENPKFTESIIAHIFGDSPSFTEVKIGNKVVYLH